MGAFSRDYTKVLWDYISSAKIFLSTHCPNEVIRPHEQFSGFCLLFFLMFNGLAV